MTWMISFEYVLPLSMHKGPFFLIRIYGGAHCNVFVNWKKTSVTCGRVGGNRHNYPPMSMKTVEHVHDITTTKLFAGSELIAEKPHNSSSEGNDVPHDPNVIQTRSSLLLLKRRE